MTTEDLPGGSAPGTAHPTGVVPQPPPVRDDEVAGLRQPDFPVALRGYDREAVDAYVDHVNRVIADLQASRSPQAAIRNALDQVGEETSGILERAHETADGITARSRAQAEERIQGAETEARELVRSAETRVRMLDTDADEIWQERKRLIDDVQRIADDLEELAEAAARRFPPETPESSADTVPIEPQPEAGAEPEAEQQAEADPPPAPPSPDARREGGAAA
jgi:DivIVA domain-containing protein